MVYFWKMCIFVFMLDESYYKSEEVLELVVKGGMVKVKKPIWQQALLAVLAGAFIAFAASASNVAAYGFWLKPETYGLGKLIAGLVFPVGLMFVLFTGAELFTGNSLLVMPLFEKKIGIVSLLKNWVVVYLGNFLGALLIVFFVIKTGQLKMGGCLLGGATIRIAVSKVSLNFLQAIILGVMCNWIVCLSIWMANSSKDVIGKIFSAFFPIFLFVISGFEHSVANMYYVPVGIFAKSFPEFVSSSNLSETVLANLTWGNFFVKNLLPVTIGNIIGGGFFVGFIHWVCYRKKS